MTHQTTAMREAFSRIPVPNLVAPVGDYIVKSLLKGAGRFKPNRLWNAHLSFKTAQKLKHAGFLPQ